MQDGDAVLEGQGQVSGPPVESPQPEKDGTALRNTKSLRSLAFQKAPASPQGSLMTTSYDETMTRERKPMRAHRSLARRGMTDSGDGSGPKTPGSPVAEGHEFGAE